ncbi:MAG: glycosyltransferase family 4 protein [Chloroflexi bacterium]|nr:glycosyltransferase family 4 protein [Chloroflexota bacterium]
MNLLFARSLFLPDDLGGNRYPYELVRRLADRGHTVTVLTPSLHGRFPQLRNVRYRHYPVSRRHPLATHVSNLAGSTLAARGQHDYAAVLAGSYDVALGLHWAGVTPPLPLVFFFHSEFYSEWVQRSVLRHALRAYMRGIERQVFALSRRLIAVSRFSARQISQRLASAEPRIRVIPTGVDTGYFRPPSAGDRAARSTVLGVGRLVRVKQFDRLISAFAAVRGGGIDARLVIAGGGPEQARLERLAQTYGLEADVELAGYCDPPRLRALMQAADLQVCSSAFENFSLAILEGMACGLPVLATPGGGTPELVGQLDPALVLSSDSTAALVDGMRRWLGDAERRRERGRDARRLAVEHFDWERVVDRVEAVCAEVAVGHR